MSFAWKRNRRIERQRAQVNFMSRKQRRQFRFEDPKTAKQAGLGSTKGDHK